MVAERAMTPREGIRGKSGTLSGSWQDKRLAAAGAVVSHHALN
jgi:hypothetical protein